ncbi:MAG: imidazole glycerol phosphate synthase subunit HisH [Verrucomicrobiae bacterium]
MKRRATIVDYGLGNLHSVANALRYIGMEVELAETGEMLHMATHVVLPGVGAFADAMAGLRNRGHDIALRRFVESGQGPLLGICLGAQLLLGESAEFGTTQGLGIIPGKVASVPANGQKIPHVGWKMIELTKEGLRQNIVPSGLWSYFVHSFHAVPSDPAHVLGRVKYGSDHITALVGYERVIGCQFHPEKSGQEGLAILKSFMQL